MYGIKNAVLAKEHNPDTKVTIYYADVRAFGKGFEEFYQMARGRFGVEFIRGRVGEVREDPKTKNLIVSVEDILNNAVLEREHDLVVLSPGIQPPKGLQHVVEDLHLDVDDEGYVMVGHSFLGAVNTTIPGVKPPIDNQGIYTFAIAVIKSGTVDFISNIASVSFELE